MEAALAKISRAHDLIGRLEPFQQKGNEDCRVSKTPFSNLTWGWTQACRHVVWASVSVAVYLRALANIEAKLRDVEAGHEKLVSLQASLIVEQHSVQLLVYKLVLQLPERNGVCIPLEAIWPRFQKQIDAAWKETSIAPLGFTTNVHHHIPATHPLMTREGAAASLLPRTRASSCLGYASSPCADSPSVGKHATYIFINTQSHVYMHIYICMYMCVHTHIYIYLHVCLYVY